MRRFRVGVQLHPMGTDMEDLRAAWHRADALGVDSIWTADHFFPVWGPLDGPNFEGWSLLAAMAADTATARIGILVTGNGYRNPDLLAHMACTIDHVSGGRLILGIGAGWFEQDYVEYGYDFGAPRERLEALELALRRIKNRLSRLNPRPAGPLPILVGGAGERVTLRIVAQYADMWNSVTPPATFARKNAILDEWCVKVGRDPGEIERTVVWGEDTSAALADELVAAGATHLIFSCGHPFDLSPVQTLLDAAQR